MASLCSMPDELLLLIASDLESEPLSITEILRIPKADLFKRDLQLSPLKALSLTSRRWRRLTLPLLMNHVVLNLNKLGDLSLDVVVKNWCTTVQVYQPRTLLVAATEPLTIHATGITCEKAIFASWNHIFNLLDPERIVIHANHGDLLLLLGGSCEEYPNPNVPMLRALALDRKDDPAEYIPTDHSGTDFGLSTNPPGLKSTMLHARPWAHISLNETDGKPQDTRQHLWTSLIEQIFPRCCLQTDTPHTHRWPHVRDQMSFLDSFTIIATNVGADQMPSIRINFGIPQFQYLRELHLSLVPRPADVDISHLSPFEQADWWQRSINSAAHHYSWLRFAMLRTFTYDDWRLRKVISYDDEAFQQYPICKRLFSNLVTASVPSARDQDHEWGRVWEIIETNEGLKFTVHD